MTQSTSSSAGDLIDLYEESIRKDPETAIRAIMWLAIYDEKSASWARDLLEKGGVIPNPGDETAKRNQLRKLDRKRVILEQSVRLPSRNKKGATSTYKQALGEWKRINRRPTKNELLVGWVPQPLPVGIGKEKISTEGASSVASSIQTRNLASEEDEIPPTEGQDLRIKSKLQSITNNSNTNHLTQQELDEAKKLLDADDDEDAALYS